MYKINKLGGIDPTESYLIKKAKEADLVTLPVSVKGTNCYNCKYIRNVTQERGFCSHPKVQQNVNERMCCALWDAKGIYRVFGKIDSKYG